MSLPPFELERYLADYEFRVPWLLGCSDCESMRLGDVLALEPGAEASFMDLALQYTESQGDPALREAIAQLYPGLTAAHVLVHTGAEEAIYTFMRSCLQAADHIVVHYPAYQSLSSVAASVGCAVSRWEAREDRGWALDLQELQDLLRPETKVVVVNSPHNPTGYVMPPAVQQRLIDLCAARGIILFSDEVYRYSEYSDSERCPAACTLEPSAISLGVMSKSFGLPGLRIGWIATRNTTVYQRMAAYKDYTTICNPAPSEFLARLALQHRTTVLARNVELMQRNLQLANDFFERHATRFRWIPPQAGPIAFPSSRGGASVAALCHSLVQQEGVSLLPGHVYGAEFSHHFRIGLGRASFPEALKRFDAFLQNQTSCSNLGLTVDG